MPHFNRQHEPTDINEAVVITQAQLNDLKQFLIDLHDRSAAPPIAAMSDAQFAELRSLLQPGFELSKLYLAQVRAAHGTSPQVAPSPSTPVEPVDDSTDRD